VSRRLSLHLNSRNVERSLGRVASSWLNRSSRSYVFVSCEDGLRYCLAMLVVCGAIVRSRSMRRPRGFSSALRIPGFDAPHFRDRTNIHLTWKEKQSDSKQRPLACERRFNIVEDFSLSKYLLNSTVLSSRSKIILNNYIYIYIYIYMCVCVCVCIKK